MAYHLKALADIIATFAVSPNPIYFSYWFRLIPVVIFDFTFFLVVLFFRSQCHLTITLFFCFAFAAFSRSYQSCWCLLRMTCFVDSLCRAKIADLLNCNCFSSLEARLGSLFYCCIVFLILYFFNIPTTKRLDSLIFPIHLSLDSFINTSLKVYSSSNK